VIQPINRFNLKSIQLQIDFAAMDGNNQKAPEAGGDGKNHTPPSTQQKGLESPHQSAGCTIFCLWLIRQG
jgi:hypothetical protein